MLISCKERLKPHSGSELRDFLVDSALTKSICETD